MQTMTGQETAANFMTAAAHLLIGAADRQEELNKRVAIIYGGHAPNPQTLIHWGEWVRQSGRPIVFLSFDTSHGIVPTVALVCVTDGQTRMFEHCHLWQRRDGGPAILIPDSFKWGSYAIDAELRLEHRARPPVRNERAALEGIRRAYRRLMRIAEDQIESGLRLTTPKRLETRAA